MILNTWETLIESASTRFVLFEIYLDCMIARGNYPHKTCTVTKLLSQSRAAKSKYNEQELHHEY